MAEHLGKAAGFALCYPNITGEFQRVAGNADVADYHRIQQKMETASEAFLAWTAVAPEFSDKRISDALAEELRIQPAVTQAALKDFSGVQRRFTVRGEQRGVTVVDQ